MNIETVFPKVVTIIADTLVVEESDVQLKKRLIDDLGAESIDFLDFIFQLEQEFKVKIPRGQIEDNARGDLSEIEFEVDGILTEKGVSSLRQQMSEVPEDQFQPGMKVAQIPLLFNVETLCKLVINAEPKH